ncbi:GH3 auxin-responsive promoter family protein [Breznakiella homolactica]|uniref:GH3 auxin-responsive promoter family protein n=1 Tax=Breznakiella homolactica TaxID=2798577 RepID=A0A7T8B7Y8_9SPIR|nr:GH3 auxin-responsive promoter family protein [Breznakiella homolactica]QQO08029.1 GH3 auxin-responsive promoter family protein [Breznakiella homolactica]
MQEKKTKGLWKIKAGLGFVGRKAMKELNRESRDGRNAQEKTLRRMLTVSKDTVYGREHHFEEILKAETPEKLFELYRGYVPVNQYEDLRHYVERHKNGEPDVLFPGKPKMYATTSGTTNEPKWIPITDQYYQEVYNNMNRLWFYTLLKNKPKTFDGPTLSIVGKAIEGAAPDGTVYGSISGISQRDIPKFMRPVHTAPADVFGIEDYKARYYALMRMGIERDVHCIITANPSTLIEMQNNANEFYDDYVEDIEKGTVGRRFDIPEDIRAALEGYTKPNPARAQELRELKTQYGTVLPKHYWPNMQVINTWMCGNTAVYFDRIKDSFAKDSVFHEFSYFASECRPGVVLKSSTKDTVIFGHKTYFEFIHESELDSPNPRIYQMHEVKAGQRYCIIVTTSAGLYRYNMNDLVEITGFYNEYPTISMIQKINGTINLTGEKLHESQFIKAINSAEKDKGLKLTFFIGFADLKDSVYRLYYEFADPGVSQAEAEDFTRLVDTYLKKYNVEYQAKRDSFRLKDPVTELLVPESFEQFKSRCIDMGYRDGQFKLNLLMQDERRHQMFRELVKKADLVLA